MRTLPFTREHLMLLDARDYEKKNIIPFLSGAFLDVVELSSLSYSLVKEGRIITCLGGFQLWDGVWEVWQIPSVYVMKYKKEYCQTIRGLLDSAADRIKIWRMQTVSPADELHDRWMKFIGFECEGTFKEYSRFKVDYRMWARRYNHGS